MNALTAFEKTDELFPELFRRFMRPMAMNLEPMGDIRVDIEENDKRYTVRAELPGAKKDDIRVEVDGNRVAISAEVRKNYEKKEGERVLVRETYSGSVSRTFTLACDIDESGIVAKLEDGVLQLTLPKRANARNRLVKIQ